jgi:thymidylate synthase
MKNYLALMRYILDNGEFHGDRTGVGTISTFGTQLRWDLTKGFPLVTTKKVFLRGIIKELLWILDGSGDVQKLIDENVHIWDDWIVKQSDIDNPSEKLLRMIEEITGGKQEIKDKVTKEMSAVVGTIGPLYGTMMRSAPGGTDMRALLALHGSEAQDVIIKNHAPDKVKKLEEKFGVDTLELKQAIIQEFVNTVDQIQLLILNLKANPHSRRHIVNCWFPEFLPDERLSPEDNVLCGRQALAPCHVMQQYHVSLPKEEGGKMRLSLMMTQRSADYAIGVPFNIASYSLLLMMIAQVVDMEPFEFIWSGGDTHIYRNTIEQSELQLTREPRPLPTMKLNPNVKSIYDFKLEDFTLEGYDPHPAIKVVVAK